MTDHHSGSAMGPPVLERVLAARVAGVSPTHLTLTYRIADPVAIAVTVPTCCGVETWQVARDVVRDGLTIHRAPVYADEAAAAVHLSTLPETGLSLLRLRHGAVYWPLTVSRVDLAEFLVLTYQACPPEREQSLVERELAAQVGFFRLAHQNDHGNEQRS